MAMSSSQKYAKFIEESFSCPICLEGRFEMVYGQCQHRICTQCLYSDKPFLRGVMRDCPLCFWKFSFPFFRPKMLSDTIQMQQILGVRACSNSGCKQEMWEWEMEDHLRSCSFGPPSESIAEPASKRTKRSTEKNVTKGKESNMAKATRKSSRLQRKK